MTAHTLSLCEDETASNEIIYIHKTINHNSMIGSTNHRLRRSRISGGGDPQLPPVQSSGWSAVHGTTTTPTRTGTATTSFLPTIDDHDEKKGHQPRITSLMRRIHLMELQMILFLTFLLVLIIVFALLPQERLSSFNYVQRGTLALFSRHLKNSNVYSYKIQPRVLFTDTNFQHVYHFHKKNRSHRRGYNHQGEHPRKVVPMISSSRQRRIDDSDEYDGKSEWETRDCKAMYHWQTLSYPTCNLLHEMKLNDPNNVKLIANGYWRDVWRIMTTSNTANTTSIIAPLILKTIRYEHDYTDRNFDRHRRDAVAMERLTSSSYILDIYGFCGNSALTEFADGGDIDTYLFHHNSEDDEDSEDRERHREPRITDLEKLQIATQAAIALSEFHTVEAIVPMAHTDISPSQFVKVGNRFKLNDFNRVRFLRWNEKKNETCSYYVGSNPGKFRSPEEYKYDPQSEKVDVYSLGNVIYVLLMNRFPFAEEKSKKAKAKVMAGHRPSIFKDIWESEDPIVRTLLNAMFACHEQDPERRATSTRVAEMLRTKLDEVDPNFLKSLQ